MKGFLITGDRSGAGKTSITLGIAGILARDRRVQTFKVGMDYIDPSYHTAVTGRPCRNLDGYVMNEPSVREIFAHGCRDADIAVVEGVRGLFEGADPFTGCGSTAEIARITGLPVVLVVNARSITRSAAAIVKGFMAFDPEIRIAGVILNNIGSPSHQYKATKAIEHYCGIPVVGAIPRTDEMHLPMRHLGLVPFREGQCHEEFLERIESIMAIVGEHVDMDRLLSLAAEINAEEDGSGLFEERPEKDVRIAIALDEAFNFYYADLFDILPSLGAGTVFFSPIHDRLPEADGYIIGGGYPELFAGALEANSAMREAVREVSRNGVPVYAECGGLIYLTRQIRLRPGWMGSGEERTCEFCGVYPGETGMPAKRVIGYVEGTSSAASPLGAADFRGHEFHHSDVRLGDEVRYAYRLDRGIGISDRFDGALMDRTQGSYTHLHPVASLPMFYRFVNECRLRT